MFDKTLCLKLFLVNILIYSSQVTCEEINLDDDEEHLFESTSYENNKLIINLDFGYQLLVEVSYLTTEYNKADFLIIKSGAQIEDVGTGIIFAQRLTSPEKLVILATKILIEFVVGETAKPGKNGGFKVIYKRIGDKSEITTSIPSTTNTLPTAPPEERTSLEVYVTGKHLIEEESKIEDFKKTVAKMAILYCDMNNILYDPSKDITEKNVRIQKLEHCLYNWPGTENCVKIIFAVPIILLQSKTSDYELSSKNLELMWQRYSTEFLKTINLEIYNPPDPDSANTSWQMVIGLTIFIFVVIIIGIALFKDRSKLCKGKKREVAHKILPSDIEDKDEHRESVISSRYHPENILDYIEIDNRPYQRTNFASTSAYGIINDSYDDDDENDIKHFDKFDALKLSVVRNIGTENDN